MNILSGFCATLLMLCQPFISQYDFKYNSNKEFVHGIIQCTQSFNAVIPPQHRVIIVVSVAQAVLESDWGNSRFAKLGNNFYGIIETDPTEPHITALNNPNVLLKTYGRKCESVADYIGLLNVNKHFIDYQELRMKQFVTRVIDIDKLVDTLRVYAKDPFYVYKVKDTIKYLYVTYPTFFKKPTNA